jgi:ribosome-associated heat shock protein Hsp15
MHDPSEPVRVDKWLWAARLAKTRPLAVEAVSGGRVQVNGQRVKASRDVKPGDRLEITLPQGARMALEVRGTALRRLSASEAVLLYDETEESREAREQHAAERRLAAPRVEPGARPTKRDRRRFEATRGSRGGRGGR